MSKLEETRTRLGVTPEVMNDIIAAYTAVALAGAEGVADQIPNVLNKYENEIIRQSEVISRLQTKIRNYRSGIKQLQRAHEASLHREAALKETINQEREVAFTAACQVGDSYTEDAPYSPVRFNNESAYSPAGVGIIA